MNTGETDCKDWSCSVKKERYQKALEVLFDNDLKIKKCTDHKCIKTSQKLTVLHGISAYANTNKKTLVTKAFINSQFGHCTLIRISNIRTRNIP